MVAHGAHVPDTWQELRPFTNSSLAWEVGTNLTLEGQCIVTDHRSDLFMPTMLRPSEPFEYFRVAVSPVILGVFSQARHLEQMLLNHITYLRLFAYLSMVDLT